MTCPYDTTCPHGFASPGQCIDCMYEGNMPVTRPPRVTVVSKFTAAYDGFCLRCESPISEGDKIAKLSDETYVHADCT